nr:hypothetical protein RVX_2167 [Nitratidesulfovibrio sp. HK-II]
MHADLVVGAAPHRATAQGAGGAMPSIGRHAKTGGEPRRPARAGARGTQTA